MKLHPTEYFVRKYNQLSQQLQRKTDKALKLLLENLHHPSLRAKKYNEKRDIWQARVNRKYRFYFLIKKDTYVLLNIRPHK
jgi:mRNA-degrading endonuclease RelE of RelBE toxin-antitoxin system